MKVLVNKIIPFSSVDGPGNRTVIFLQGCNINCKYCHNPETRDISSNECSNDLKYMTPREVMDIVLKQIPFISGITVSGGECMLNSDFLCELFILAKEKNLSTLIDSNGTILFEGKEDLLKVTDGVMLDIKAFLNSDFKNVADASNENVLKNFKFLSKNNKLTEVRCVICPELYDFMDSIDEFILFLYPYYKKHKFLIKLIKFRPLGVRNKYKDMKIPSNEYMESIKETFIYNKLDNVIIV